ncbi:YaaA family protein [Mangrovihabitans endophyticus]|uniref:UPF0246 protein n=1 Tax=Mangrovihabitans endophyticus TaxID=1751298 RepID=A0A8J3FP06_9ACTN|nr:peroxide stress protein YaaA [Mangrovihabitans endophyticus]GGK91736.1 UPF0246 protein [Mangrovihabitans endophyticus]
MLILLPPSEGKTAPGPGAPLDPAGLFLPRLTRERTRVLNRLVRLCRRGSARGVAASLAMLGLSAAQTGEVTRNAGLPEAPAAPATGVYTGVLYGALDWAGLPSHARAWLAPRAVVFSGLWGVVRLHDRIPAYRCPVHACVPPIGGLAAYWRRALAPALADAVDGPVLDLRSGAYQAMWPAPAAAAVQVRVLHETRVDGVPRRTVVSHVNKAAKGRLVRSLAHARATPRTPADLITALRDLGHTVEPRDAPAGRARQVDLVVTQL